MLGFLLLDLRLKDHDDADADDERLEDDEEDDDEDDDPGRNLEESALLAPRLPLP